MLFSAKILKHHSEFLRRFYVYKIITGDVCHFRGVFLIIGVDFIGVFIYGKITFKLREMEHFLAENETLLTAKIYFCLKWLKIEGN